MPIAETDLELLETYLDGALPMPDAEGLWRRLAIDADYAAALEDLRIQRAVRQVVWKQAEPDDAAAAAVASRVAGALRRRRIFDIVNRSLTYAIGAAACIMIGFHFGGISNSNLPSMAPQAASSVPTVTVSDNTANQGLFPLAVRDSSGRLISVQSFNSPQEREQFISNVDAQPAPASSPRDLGNNVVPVSDEQF
jgi:hypothetical protein